MEQSRGLLLSGRSLRPELLRKRSTSGTSYTGEPLPLEERKAALKKLLRQTHPGIAYNRTFDVEGSIVFHHACKLGCEGIVSKRLGSPPVGGLDQSQESQGPSVRREAEEDLGR